MALLTRVVVAVALVWGSSACHAIFDGELGPIACSAEGVVGPPACPEGQRCVEGSCQALGSSLGGPCASDLDCPAPSFCFDPAAAGAAGAPRCTVPCCTSSDCGEPVDGLVCWSPVEGTGALCWPASERGRGALGRLGAGATCTRAEECRSGACEDDRCIDHCCFDASCEGSQVCRVRATATFGTDTWTCGPPPTNNAGQTLCDTDVDCRHGSCRMVSGFDQGPVCVEPCCSSTDCNKLQIAGSYQPMACVIGEDGLRGCAAVLPTSAVEGLGAPCSSDDACASGFCFRDGDASYCSDLCCDDASCGDEARFACRGGLVGGVWSLRCVRK